VLQLPGLLGERAVAHERIEINPQIMGGKPVIRGTPVPVESVPRKLGAGMTVDAIVIDHPRLTPDDIRAGQALQPLSVLSANRWFCGNTRAKGFSRPDRVVDIVALTRGAPGPRRYIGFRQ
jgi:uncharacterized protein (DUF433 family)